ncbi:hypothetical protein Q4485_13965 [Granulosicoccaceae sp. 1_MG-2023]|nr:hypothetical protein [Granulosicoccaceae sp. 1_MG-2023]
MMFRTEVSHARFAALALVFLLNSACGGSGGSGSSDDGNDQNSDAADSSGSGQNTGSDQSGSGNSAAGDTDGYDLAAYQFPLTARSTNGRVDFVERVYSQEDGSQIIPLERAFADNNGLIDEYSTGERIKSFEITGTEIEETLYDPDGFRTSSRYVEIGETYMDANVTTTTDSFTLEQNASCELKAHYDSFDLSGVTGDYTLASGTYTDVLEVYCVTSFISGGQKSPHTLLTSYFAKDIGVIFNVGTLFLFGDVYIVDEY